MFRHYLLVAFRSLRRQKGYAAINLAGLAVGLACCLLLALYVRHETSVDRFHDKADRIVRLTTQFVISGVSEHYAAAGSPLADAMRENYPEVEAATRIRKEDEVVRQGADAFQEDHIYYADPTVFDVFSFHLVRGHAAEALAAPHTVLLSETTARKYFGDQDPVGRPLEIGDEDYTVTGVFAPPPGPSHLHAEFLASMATIEESERLAPEDWVSGVEYYTYLLLRDGTSAEALEAQLPAMSTTRSAR